MISQDVGNCRDYVNFDQNSFSPSIATLGNSNMWNANPRNQKRSSLIYQSNIQHKLICKSHENNTNSIIYWTKLSENLRKHLKYYSNLLNMAHTYSKIFEAGCVHMELGASWLHWSTFYTSTFFFFFYQSPKQSNNIHDRRN